MPPPLAPPPPALIAMHSGGHEEQPGPKELEDRINSYLLTALRTVSSLNLDISLYLILYVRNARRDPFGGNDLDGAYTMYEEQANNCRRLWMQLRAASEKRNSLAKATGDLSPPRSRLGLERSPSPLEYQSALDEDEETKGNNRVTPMDVDPVKTEQDVLQLPAPALRPPGPKPKVCLSPL